VQIFRVTEFRLAVKFYVNLQLFPQSRSIKRLSVRLSVSLSVRLSKHSIAGAACGVFAAECRAPGEGYHSTAGGRRPVLTSSGAAAQAAARRSAANVSNVTFAADVGSCTYTC